MKVWMLAIGEVLLVERGREYLELCRLLNGVLREVLTVLRAVQTFQGVRFECSYELYRICTY